MTSTPPATEFKRGDDATLARVAITDGDGPVDLTDGWTYAWQVRPSAESATAITVTIDDTDAATGVLVGSIGHAITATMTPGAWVSDIELHGPNGRQSSRTFPFRVLADVTRPTTEEGDDDDA